MRKEIIFTAFLAMLLIAGVGTTVYAKSYSVFVMDPTGSGSDAKGVLLDNHWVGEIPIELSGGSTADKTVAYCMDPQKVIESGSSYGAKLSGVEDSAMWRAISYVLSWNYPATDVDAAVDQVAIWRLLDGGFVPEPWLRGTEVDLAGKKLADLAYGKDVVRETDQLSWVSPVAGDMVDLQAIPSQTFTFEAQLKSECGVPRANVRVDFSAALNALGETLQLNSTYITPTTAYTNCQGIAQVKVTVPADTNMGSTIEVKASTQSMWPQQYIDLKDQSTQNLIGIGTTFELTTSCNLCILANIMVVPEYTVGALGAFAASAIAFLIYAKIKQTKNHKY